MAPKKTMMSMYVRQCLHATHHRIMTCHPTPYHDLPHHTDHTILYCTTPHRTARDQTRPDQARPDHAMLCHIRMFYLYIQWLSLCI